MPDTPTYLDLTGLTTYDGLIKAEISGKIDIGGRAGKIPYGNVDATSTATVFTATVDGLTELTDGTCVMLHNGVITSASGFTVNVNGLGAKKCYNNLTNATQDTTIFNVAYTMLFVYATALDGGNGGWWIYRGYDANTNTIGYQLRSNSGNLVASDTGYRYRLWLTSADGSKWVPINTSTSTNATTNRTLNTRPIDPFGPIVYRATNGTCTAGTGIGATAIWQQYTLTIGYSYMASGFSLTAQDSVYLRCTPQTDGSAVMQDIVQALPTSKDGKIYIHLGTAYSATGMELTIEHAVYWHDGTGIRLWTGAESGGGPEPSSTTPAMDGTAAVGTATTYARADHVHPTDTSRQATLVSGTNIKTINGTSILGSGDITTPTYTLPTASTSTLGGVKVDGSTITITDGVISSSGGGSVSMEDTAVDAAVEAAWPDYLVSITLTNPMNASEAASPPCKVFNIPTAQSWYSEDEQLGQVDSPTGSATISVPTSSYGIYVRFYGTYPAVSGSPVVSGGVSLLDTLERGYTFIVIESGTVTISDVDYDD